MADPLSIAGSIVGIVSLADTVLRSLYRYDHSVSQASEEIKELLVEVQALTGVLHNISVLADTLGGGSDRQTLKLQHAYACLHTLKEIDDRTSRALARVQQDSRSKSMYGKLKWPFSASKTKELLETLRRQKETLSLALQSDSLASLIQLLSNQDAVHDKLSNIQRSLDSLKELSHVRMDEERQKTLDFFLKVNPQPNLYMNGPRLLERVCGYMV
ncbi:hypothetical protein F4778DRAFT_696481 [Xylariomycetidae sp. FL2044]|nr:hypothetical protein F4778DRAFT_696481 [Xylariomycetidae sp. FL2044]